jgi:hypothetical protein
MRDTVKLLEKLNTASKPVQTNTLDEWLDEQLCEDCPALIDLRDAIIDGIESGQPVRASAGEFAVRSLAFSACEGVLEPSEDLPGREDRIKSCGNIAVNGAMYFLNEAEKLQTPSPEA